MKRCRVHMYEKSKHAAGQLIIAGIPKIESTGCHPVLFVSDCKVDSESKDTKRMLEFVLKELIARHFVGNMNLICPEAKHSGNTFAPSCILTQQQRYNYKSNTKTNTKTDINTNTCILYQQYKHQNKTEKSWAGIKISHSITSSI